MLATNSILTSTQLSRNSIVEIIESPSPVREAALEAFRRRNAALDAIFYDVGNVTHEEAVSISPWLAREGALLVVPPRGRPLRLFASIDDFAQQGGRQVRVLAVAGVGSSALGSAAFARNIAEALDTPVAAVVSGYGLADLVTEAAGGWFWFRTMNGMRHGFERLDRSSLPPAATLPSSSRVGAALSDAVSLSLDTRTVHALLSRPELKFSLLVGHSKGNLVVSEALFELEKRPGFSMSAVDDRTTIVTVSAGIYMPAFFTNIIDVMGTIDWFGALNSRPDVDIEVRRPLAWHHTNTDLPFHLPVEEIFRDLHRRRRLI